MSFENKSMKNLIKDLIYSEWYFRLTVQQHRIEISVEI